MNCMSINVILPISFFVLLAGCVPLFKKSLEREESQTMKPLLKTERLLIRSFTLEDDQAVLDLFSDGGAPHLAQFGPLDIDYARGFLQHTICSYEKNGLGLWAVIEKATGKLIGDCGLHKVKIGENEEKIELAYRIHKQLWGKGFATEAAQAVLTYAFDVLHLSEVVSCIAHNNERSVRVAEKIGMTYWKEGMFMGKSFRVYKKTR